MAAKVIIFPLRFIKTSSAIRDEIERLIEILDERELQSTDCEPDPDFEDNEDAESETRPDWRPTKVIVIRKSPCGRAMEGLRGGIGVKKRV